MTRYRRIDPRAIKVDLPNTFQQRDYTCGAAALLAICAYWGVGPEDEATVVRDLRIDRRIGTHPFQLARLARRYGLRVREHQPMRTDTLIDYLDGGTPVLVMIQAWGGAGSYRGVWKHGHWVVAIGHDDAGVYFEDPSIEAARGFLTYAALDERWHDVGPHGVHVERYGMALWRSRGRAAGYATRARAID